MTRKKRKPSMDLADLSFDEALVRLIQTDRKELDDHNKRVEREAEEIEGRVRDQFEDIRSVGRRFKKPFSL